MIRRVIAFVAKFFHKKPDPIEGMEFGIIDGKGGEIDE